MREKLGLHRYICLVFIPSPALLQKNKHASDWVDAKENMPPIGTLSRKHLDLSVVELTRCVFRGLRLGGKSYYLYMMHVVKLRMRWVMYGLDAIQELGVIRLFI